MSHLWEWYNERRRAIETMSQETLSVLKSEAKVPRINVQDIDMRERNAAAADKVELCLADATRLNDAIEKTAKFEKPKPTKSSTGLYLFACLCLFQFTIVTIAILYLLHLF